MAKKQNRTQTVLYTLLFLLCAVVFFVSSFFLIEDLAERFAAQKEYDGLGLISVDVKDNPDLANRQIADLKKINPDTTGRIIIQNTNIDYPVVQGENNEYYLNVSFEDKYSSSGCIYMDYRNKNDYTDPQTVIYGHKMITGTMFNNLKFFKKKSFLEEKPTITIITEEKTLVYEAIVTVVTNRGGDFIRLNETNEDYLRRCYASAVAKTDTTATNQDRLLILFTCEDDKDGRELVIAKLISETIMTPAPTPPQPGEQTL